MANVVTKIEKIHFEILDDRTVCQVLYSSSEPENAFWGGGWKCKEFPSSLSVKDILSHVHDYIKWDDCTVELRPNLN